ncbi:hypothetical protein AAK943_20050, partial [Emergencia timonensis]
PSVRQLDYYITLDPLCQALFSAASCMCLPPLSDSLIILPSFPYSVKCLFNILFHRFPVWIFALTVSLRQLD